LLEVPVEWIRRGRYQPRRRIDEDALEELAESIRAQGVVQPIVVRPVSVTEPGEARGSARKSGSGTGPATPPGSTEGSPGGSGDEGERSAAQSPEGRGSAGAPLARYEIIAGERRWRASERAGLQKIPAIVRDLDDDQALVALIENIQREDLNPIEEARALARLVEEFGLTHQAAAETVGRSRAAVSNLLRLLELDPEVSDMLENGLLEMGHARALLALDPAAQRRLAGEIAARGLTARQTEARVRELRAPQHASPKAASRGVDVERLERTLSEEIGYPVSIRHDRKGAGTLSIKFASLEEFQGILERLK